MVGHGAGISLADSEESLPKIVRAAEAPCGGGRFGLFGLFHTESMGHELGYVKRCKAINPGGVIKSWDGCFNTDSAIKSWSQPGQLRAGQGVVDRPGQEERRPGYVIFVA